MKAADIKKGGHYIAKVAGNLTTVRVNEILTGRGSKGNQTYFAVTNLKTRRRTTFRSAAKFRREVKVKTVLSFPGDPDVELKGSEAEQRPDPTMTIAPSVADPSKNAIAASTSSISPLASALRASVAPPPNAPHLIVEALAGTGKTTTLVEGLREVMGGTSALTPSPQQRAVWDAMKLGGKPRSACFVAFNKSIAEELKRRVPAGVEAMTMHSMGYAACRAAFGRIQASEWTTRDLIAECMGGEWKDLVKVKGMMGTLKAVEQLVGLCKQNLTEPTPDELSRLADYYDVDLNGSSDRVFDLVPQVLERAKTPKGRIDFDDMIWLPVVLGLPLRQYDLLLVDEAQDLNRCQQALAKRAGRRLVFCGDRHQSIYGFAGADSESIPRLERELSGTVEEFNDYMTSMGNDLNDFTNNQLNARRDEWAQTKCMVLPLTVTRRCGKAIVREAQRYVPEFEAHETCCEGSVGSDKMESKNESGVPGSFGYRGRVQDGDFILCRVNAPLVSECFRFIKAGRKANIQGRDIGRGLIQTIEKLKAASIPDLITKLTEWKDKEEAKENAKKFPSENRLTAIGDRFDCLMCFVDNADSPEAVVKRIEAVFTDDKTSPGIKLSSIHRAKGLEARRVFILRPPGVGPREDKMQAWELAQESNLRYVAITRAIEELVWVS